MQVTRSQAVRRGGTCERADARTDARDRLGAPVVHGQVVQQRDERAGPGKAGAGGPMGSLEHTVALSERRRDDERPRSVEDGHRARLRVSHVGLVEWIYVENRAGDCRGELPTEELGAQLL